MDILAMSLSFLVLLWQIPDKSLLYHNLLLVDLVTFIGLAYVVVVVHSGSMTLVAAKASIVITVMLHISKWIWQLRHK